MSCFFILPHQFSSPFQPWVNVLPSLIDCLPSVLRWSSCSGGRSCFSSVSAGIWRQQELRLPHVAAAQRWRSHTCGGLLCGKVRIGLVEQNNKTQGQSSTLQTQHSHYKSHISSFWSTSTSHFGNCRGNILDRVPESTINRCPWRNGRGMG